MGPNLTDGFPAVNASNQAVYAIGPGNFEPYADQWGLTLEQRLPARLTLEIAGMSSMGVHLYESYDANQPYPAPTPYPYARYPFRTLSWARRLSRLGGRLDLLRRATQAERPAGAGPPVDDDLPYAKSIDDSTAPGTEQDSRPPGPQYIYSLRSVRSVSPFDIPQRLMLAASYELPLQCGVRRRWAHGSRFKAGCRLLHNWR